MSSEQENIDVIKAFADQIKDSDLLSIVIEGDDDLLVYNEFEDIYDLNDPMVSVLPVGGRNTVLGIFDLLKDTPHLNKAIFIVDQDTRVINGIDPQYIHERIICTHGYSFENDIFIDGNLKEKMCLRNNEVYSSELPVLLTWYALELDRLENGKPLKRLRMDPEHLFNRVSEFTTPDPDQNLPVEKIQDLKEKYPKLMRGKTLLRFYIRIMNKRDGFSKAYTTKATIENVCEKKGENLKRIFNQVDSLISI